MSLLSPALPEATSFLPLSLQSVGCPSMGGVAELVYHHGTEHLSASPSHGFPGFPPSLPSASILSSSLLPLFLPILLVCPLFSAVYWYSSSLHSHLKLLPSFLHLLSSLLPSEISEVKKASWEKAHNKQDRGKSLGRRAGKENSLVRPSRTAQFPTTARDAPEH